MQQPNALNDLGRLILRLAVGLLIFHGIQKIQHSTESLDGIKGMLTAHGAPEWLAYGVFVGEALAPALVVLGLATRIAAFAILANMGVAVWLAHSQQFLELKEGGAWALELQGLYFLGALAVLCLGPGRIAITQKF